MFRRGLPVLLLGLWIGQACSPYSGQQSPTGGEGLALAVEGVEPPSLKEIARLAAPGSGENELGAGLGGILFPPGREEIAATGGGGGGGLVLWIWDRRDGRATSKVSFGGSDLSAIAYSPVGGMLAGLVSDVPEVRIYDITTYKSLKSIRLPAPAEDPIPSDFISSLAFSSNGKLLAAGGFGAHSTLTLWETATGREVQRLQGHEDPVYQVSFSPNGNAVASCSWDKTVRLWDVKTGRELHRLEGHTGPVYSLAFSPDGKYLATAGGGDGSVRLWDVTTGRQFACLLGHKMWVRAVAFGPEGKTVASGGATPRSAFGTWVRGENCGGRGYKFDSQRGSGGCLLARWIPPVRDGR